MPAFVARRKIECDFASRTRARGQRAGSGPTARLIAHFALLRFRPVIRLRFFLGPAFPLAAILGAFVHAQSTDPEKKKKAREEMRAVTSPTPSETPEPTAKPKPANRKSKKKKKATPTPTPKPKPKKTPAQDDEKSPTHKNKSKK